MAKYGAKYPKWAKVTAETASALPTYDTAVSLSKLVKVSDSPTNSEGSLYADNGLAEYAAEFVSADIDVEVTEVSNAVAAKLYGATVSETTGITFGSEDGAPYGGFGFVTCKIVNSVKSFVGIFYPKVKAQMQGESYETKGDSISFATGSIKFKGVPANTNAWKIVSPEFTEESQATAWVDAKFQ